MKTKRTPESTPAERTIDPNAVYFRDDLCRLLRVRLSTVREELKAGRLRVAKRAGRYYFLGSWLIQWIAEGELPRKARGNERSST